jgi:diguanylate cyclase (GGDEF)-like protein/PAS domain S-box-containing protein
VGSTPNAVRRDAGLRVVDSVDSADGPSQLASIATEIRQLTRETLRVVGWEFELAHRSVAWHAPIGSILAISPRDTVSVTPSDGLEPTSADVAEWLIAPIVTTMQAGAPWRDYELQQRLESANGDVQHFLVRARQVREGGVVVGCAGVVVDISDRHLVESNLRELIDRYRRLSDLSPDGIVVHQAGRIVYANRAGIELVGATTAEQVLGRSIIDFVHPDSLGPTLERISTLSEDAPVSEGAEATLVRLDGTPWVVESVSVLTRWEGEDAFQVILRDLTDRKRAEHALRYQASLVEHVSDAIIGVDATGRVESWNPAAELIYGVTADVAVGAPLRDLVGLPEGFGETPLRDVESIHHRPDGNLVIVRASVTNIYDHAGAQTGFVVVCADTTERRRAEDERRAVEQLHSTVIEAVDEGIVVADAGGVVVAANPAARRILSLEVEVGARLIDCVTGPDGVVGADRRALSPSEHPVARALALNEALHDAVIGLVSEDSERWLSLSCRPLPATSGAAAGTVCSFADVTNVINAQQELSYRATHDELTGLCNRVVFVDSLQHALARSRRTQTNTAVLFIDVDRFKLVNDTLGHAAGDEVLTEIARRLQGATRSMDRVGRIAGDEFIVMCNDVNGIEPVAARAAELERVISEPIRLSNGRQPALHASIGIAFAEGGDGEAEELLRDAHVAMRRAKEQGGTKIEIFDYELQVQAERRRQLELALRIAIENDGIDVYFQPIVSVASPRILGVEALARFTHPELGSVPPTEFIHVAEETDLILSLGIAVLAKACAQAAQWRANDPAARDLYVSVNLSARQLYDPQLVSQVETVLRTTGLDPDALWLEITESVLMDDAPTAARIFDALRALGVHLVVDDFGTGYSSLAYLQAFPVEMLKIDRSFVNGLDEDDSSEAIVRAIISLAGSLKLRVVAEGVERPSQLARLEQLGCDSFQGYLCSPARPPQDLDFSVVTLEEKTFLVDETAPS